MKKGIAKFFAASAFLVLATAAYAQPSTIIVPTTTSCPGTNWGFWYANTIPSPITNLNNTAYLVLFDSVNFNFTVLQALPYPVTTPINYIFSAASGHGYVLNVWVNLPTSTPAGPVTVGTVFSYPGNPVPNGVIQMYSYGLNC